MAKSKSRKKARRTTHRSKSGKKLYAVRGKDGKFKDIQTYKRAHTADIKRESKAEKAKKILKEHKKKALFKGIATHILTYIILCGFLVILGVPLYISFILFMVLAWGLFVLSYAMWNKK